MSLKHKPKSKIKTSIQKGIKANTYQPTWLNSQMNLPKKNGFVGVTIQEDEKPKPKKKNPKVVLNGFEGHLREMQGVLPLRRTKYGRRHHGILCLPAPLVGFRERIAL